MIRFYRLLRLVLFFPFSGNVSPGILDVAINGVVVICPAPTGLRRPLLLGVFRDVSPGILDVESSPDMTIIST